MARNPSPYKRMPGKGSQLLIPPPYVYLLAIFCPLVLLVRNQVRLWEGSDHVLNVTNTGSTEQYKRFYFKEIQAIVLRRTPDWTAWNGVFATLMTIFAFISGASDDIAARVASGIPASVFLVALISNIILGRTCSVHIKTAIQTEQLFSLDRMRPALKTINRITARIMEIQGDSAPAAPENTQIKEGSELERAPTPQSGEAEAGFDVRAAQGFVPS